MKAVVDRVVQYPHRYQLRNVNTGEVLGTFDLEPITGTISVVGTKIDKELFDSIASDISARLVSNGGDAKDNVITYTMASNRSNIASGEKLSVSFGKIAKYFNDLKAIAFSGDRADIGLGNVDNTSDANKPVSNATQQALNLKANASDVYTKTETDGLLNNKANKNDVYSKTKTDELLNNKANKSDVYTKSETDGLLNDKANKTETDNKINKPLYNLGAYDTISGNVITRQTGYLTINAEDITSGTGSSVNSSNAYAYTIYKDINVINESADTVIGISSNGYSVKIFDKNWTRATEIGISKIEKTITIAFATEQTQAQIQAMCPIYIQYKLATPYTEEIIEGQPLITLDQQGSQWLRDEWEKGLNLLDYNSRIVNKAINSSGQIIDYSGAYYIKVSLKPNTTYNASGCTDSTSGSVCLFTSDGTFIRKIENKNLDSKGNFITDSNVSYVLCDNLADRTQPMLVEGDHPYPYQPYNGEIVHDKDIADLYKQEYNLGYYDTMVENADGTYTITRQTGYLVLDGVENKLSEKSSSTHNGLFYNHDNYVKSNALKPNNTTIKATIICNLFETKGNDYLYNNNEYGVGMYPDGAICVGLTTSVSTLEDANAYLVQNPISIQYKLTTSYTEKVEKNHYARYNQDFILEHNKNEAERSANLIDIATLSGTTTTQDYFTVTTKDITSILENNGERNYIISVKLSNVPSNVISAIEIKRDWQYWKGTQITGNGNLIVSFTYEKGYTYQLVIYGNYGNGNGIEYTYTFSDIMLNEGSVALPYQPYEGKVVHEKELESITPGIFTKLGNKTNFSFDSGSYLVVANNGMVTVTGTDPLNVGSSANKKYLGVFMVTIAEYDGGQSLRVNTEQVFFADYVSGTISGSRFTIYKLN